MKKFLIVALALALLGAGVFFFLPKEKKVSEEISVSVETAYPEISNIKRDKTFVSRVMPENQAVVLALIPDKISAIYKNVGDSVKAGDILFKIDPKSVEEQVDLALAALELQKAQIAQSEGSGRKINQLSKELQLKSAQLQYDTSYDELSLWKSQYEDQIEEMENQIKELEATNPESPQLDELRKTQRLLDAKYKSEREAKKLSLKNQGAVLNSAKQAFELEISKIEAEEKALNDASLSKARASLDKARFYLEKSVVRSPIDGVVEFRGISLGEKPDQKTPAYIISNKSLMSASFGIPDTFIKEISVGDRAEIDYNGQILEGEISEISLVADSKSGLYNVKTIFETDGALLTGTTVTVSITAEKSENALSVPPESVLFDYDEAFVFTLKDGKAQKTPVTLGIVTKERAEILSGLTKDDLVITTNSPKIASGIKVSDLSNNYKEETETNLDTKKEEN